MLGHTLQPLSPRKERKSTRDTIEFEQKPIIRNVKTRIPLNSGARRANVGLETVQAPPPMRVAEQRYGEGYFAENGIDTYASMMLDLGLVSEVLMASPGTRMLMIC